MTTLVRCNLCPGDPEEAWEQDDPTGVKLAAHKQLRHGVKPLAGIQQLDGVAWQERAIDAVKTLAARGDDFTFYELHDMGIGDPPNARYVLGRFATVVHDLGIAHPVGYQKSARPGTKASSVRVWSGDRTRCMDCLARGVTA